MFRKSSRSETVFIFFFAMVLLCCGTLVHTANAACVAPPQGLVSWFPGEWNSKDIVIASGNTATLQGGTTFGPGKAGQSFLFDGTNDYLNVSPVGYPDITNNFTIEFWAYPTATHEIDTESTTGTACELSQRPAIFPDNGTLTYVANHSSAGISIGINGISVCERATNYFPALLVYEAAIMGWTHVAVVYENRQPALYVNGVLVRTGLTSPMSFVHPSKSMAGTSYGIYGFYSGLLDEIETYNRALSATEISAIFNAGSSGKCKCNGLGPNIVGTEGNDTITGTPKSDVIMGLGGDDIIDGGAGNDFICGGTGNDIINGGSGNDTMLGEFGNDTLNGDAGTDLLKGGPGDDTMDGGLDNTCDGGIGNDTAVNCVNVTNIP